MTQQNKKFRVKINGAWFYWNIGDATDPGSVYGVVDWSTLGQHVSKNDENGKPIFEGDVVRWIHAGSEHGYGVVHTHEGVAMTGEISDNTHGYEHNDYKGYPMYANLSMKVIGNIHDSDMKLLRAMILRRIAEEKELL